MKFLRYLGYGIGGFFLAAGLAFLTGAWIYRDIPAEVLEAKYITPASRFLNVDGVRIHYRDEGSGAPLVLIHANFGSLLSWDDAAEVLSAKHRVLRFDLTGHGLTGPDPSGDYSLARTVQLTERFVDALGLTRFSIAGTSIGGTVAMHYTAAHPERVENLILLNAGALEGQSVQRAGGGVPRVANILEYITPRAMASFMLKSRFGDPSRVDDRLIDQWYEMWLRDGQRAAILARLRAYSSADLGKVTTAIAVPTLILWGELDPQTPLEQAEELRKLLVNAPEVRVITYPGVGHMAADEAGRDIARDIGIYLDSRN
ncbi:MAG: alpha/beta hydrolase [Gammaproteobacteria bacterium]|nr:alpha/beta hydrolase [Gammaproteobacteria bacterium]MDH5276532.1 alpha/beta hydrolase [Gammaproteobacteria bacterium]